MKKRIFYPALSLLICSPCWAQNSAPAKLTLRDAVEIGLRPGQRADTALASEAVARAASLANTNKSAMFPVVEARVSGGERSVNLGAQGFGGGGQNPGFRLNPSFTNFDIRPVVTLSVLNLAQWKAWKASQLDIGRSAKERDWAVETATLRIATQYVSCLKAESELRAAEADFKLSQDLLSAAEARLKAGTVTVVDVTRAKSQVASDQNNLVKQRQARDEARANLFVAMGVAFSEEVELGQLPAAALVPDMSVEEGILVASGNRPDLQAREQAVKVATQKARAANWEKFPSLSASFDIGKNGTSPVSSEWTRNATTALNLTLFDFGRRTEKETQAAIALREEQIRLRDLRLEIARQVRVAVGKIGAAHSQRSSALSEVELSRLQLDQVSQRIAAGLSTPLELADAQTRLSRSTRSLLGAEYSLQQAGVELLNATGQLRENIEGNP